MLHTLLILGGRINSHMRGCNRRPSMPAPDTLLADPFHPGEHAAQRRAGVQRHGAAIRRYMPAQHRQFFAGLSFLPAEVGGGHGPLATLLAGPPGFIASPDETTLAITARPAADDPFTAALHPGAAMAVLGIDFATRRRNRANGQVASLTAGGIVLRVAESFGNCPQYIQQRTSEPRPGPSGPLEPLDGLDTAAQAQIAAADTFFVASAAPAGVDISHRGGRPGFVRLRGDRLTIPDFAGNRYYNTLGNLLLDPRAALLFPDFASGDLLHVSGRVEIDWDRTDGFQGAERLWHVDITRVWRRRSAVPRRWSAASPAPATLGTGSWTTQPG
jgi:predicted pyridoxine 5'-phosphate oxidase superfamily flavin-nucleotide-binding protein